MRNLIWAIILLGVGFLVGNYYGGHSFLWGHKVTFVDDSTYKVDALPSVYVTNLQKALKEERKLSWAYREMLWYYYWYKDFEDRDLGIDVPKGQGRHGNFMLDVIMELPAYEVADSILQGNWEDFDCPPEEDWLDTPW